MKHIIYTEEIGGDLKCVDLVEDEKTEELYEQTLKEGVLRYHFGDIYMKIKPAYIALVQDIKDYDFDLKDTRIHDENPERKRKK